MRGDTAQKRIAVLGAGLAGLAAAGRLTRKGEKPIIIEKEDRVGGLSRSFKRDGFVFDLGGHRFLPHNKKTADFVSGLFGNDGLLLSKRLSKIYLDGKYLHYPPTIRDILKNLGAVTCFRSCVDSLYARLKHLIKRTPEASLKDWLINRFGYTLYNIYFGPYSVKLWGRMTSQISSEWAFQRISVPHIGVAIRSLFMPTAEPIKTFAKKHLYPRGGVGTISKHMADRIDKEGGEFLMGRRAVKIGVETDGFTIDTLTSAGKEERFFASKIISSVPLTELVGILNPHCPQKILDSAKGLCFRSIRFLNLMLDAPHITRNTWMYIPEREYIFFRIQEFPNWHADNSPPGKTSLTLEIACDKGGRVWKMGDKELLEICVEDLKKIGIDVKDRISGYFCTYAEHAYPVYSLEYKKRLNEIYDYIKTLKNMVICGRQGLFRYINMDRTIESGFEAAEAAYNEKKRMDFIKCSEGKGYLETDLYLKDDA